MKLIFRSFILLFVFLSFSTSAQDATVQDTTVQDATIFGMIKDSNNNPIEFVNILVQNTGLGTISNHNGEFKLKVPANQDLKLKVSFIGFKSQVLNLRCSLNETKEINFQLELESTLLNAVEIKADQNRLVNIITLDPKLAVKMPSASGGVESLIKTLPGVSSNNELSSQYSVRGGNYDENLIYVNGIEIYRPLLIRSGQQEGLSFINSDLVSSISFSAGGFEAKYGDKMSSVLDVKYRNPTEFGASVSLSLLGINMNVEGLSKNKKLSYLFGIRQKSNRLLLKSLDTRGDYNPSFVDFQSFLNYQLNSKLKISFLSNYAKNNYTLIPTDRTTSFGTLNEAYQLKIYYDGQEVDKFETIFGALALNYQVQKDLNLNFTVSAFHTIESESFDIQGQYWIGKLEVNHDLNRSTQAIEPFGVGTYLRHARNFLQANVLSFEHKGNYYHSNQSLKWGLKLQQERIRDKLSEWEMVDSAYFSLPYPDFQIGSETQPNPDLLLNDVIKSNSELNSLRLSGFIQNQWNPGEGKNLFITGGIRFNYWDLNKELIISPRVSLAIKPNWEKDILFRFSSGVYHQPAFYKEIRNLYGSTNINSKAQKSLHFVFSSNWNFKAWSRPFKFITELYYKKLDNLIPYKIDNVRIRYLTNQIAKGYAYGLDMKINGEFVEGIESWLSLSLLKTKEDILNDGAGYIPRPTDQRINISIFFQDYLPNNPTYKVHLRLVYGSRLPFGPPNSERSQDILRIPPYRRVDIGFSKELLGLETNNRSHSIFRNFKSLWISAEILNLFQINNTISYLWVSDVNNRTYATPNFLTGRQLNFKLVLKF